jgi:hypothetical protein
VRGPVERRALRRLAAIWAAVRISGSVRGSDFPPPGSTLPRGFRVRRWDQA